MSSPSLWRTFAVTVAVLVGAGSCTADTATTETPTTSDVQSDTETSQSVTTVPDADTPLATVPPAEVTGSDSGIVTPSSAPTTQRHSTGDAIAGDGDELTEVEQRSFRIPALDDSYLADSQSNGTPFKQIDAVPSTVIASTDECALITINTLTSRAEHVWKYDTVDNRRFNCGGADTSQTSMHIEGSPSYIEGLEWIHPNFLLIDLCCEPAGGRLEIIDTSLSNRPHPFGPSGDSPSINNQNVLLYSVPHVFRKTLEAVGTIPFNLQIGESDSGTVTFDLEPDFTFHAFTFADENSPDTRGFVSELSWVGDSKIAFELWTIGLYPELYPFIGLIDIPTQSVTFKSRGAGWTMPTGDTYGNLVVAEQQCSNTPTRCDTREAKIVVLNDDTLTPIHEIAVEENIVDMDLRRGWLLVTFSNGQAGTLNLTDGTFMVIADGIVNASWME